MLPPQLRRIYQLPSLVTPKVSLSGAYMAWDVPLGPVAGAYRTMRGTAEQLAEYLGLLTAYNAAPSLRKSVEFRTIAERQAAGYAQPGASTMEELDPLSMCLGTQIFVYNDPSGQREYIVVYDGNGPLLVWVDGNFAQSPRGKIRAKIVPNPSGGGNGKAATLSATTLNVDTTVGNKYQCSPDLVTVLTALIAAGKDIYWVLPDTGAAARTTINLAAQGVKNDGQLTDGAVSGGTDNGAALMQLQTQQTSGNYSEQQPVELVMPAGGITTWTNSKFLLHYRNFRLNLNGTTAIAKYAGTDNFFQRAFYSRELVQKNADVSLGEKTYLQGVRIHTMAKDATSFLPIGQLPETGYNVGDVVFFYSKEVILGENAYPYGTKHNETPRTITAVDPQTGRRTFTPATEYEHREDWPDNLLNAGGGSGRARVLSLSLPGVEYCEYAEFFGGTIRASSDNANEAFAFIGNNVVVRNVTCEQGATITEALTSFKAFNWHVKREQEGDKCNGDTELTDCDFDGFFSNFGGTRSLKMVGGSSGKSLQVAPPLVDLDGVACHAGAFTTDNGTKQHPADPAVGAYPGGHYITRKRLKGLKLSADNQAAAYLDPALYFEHQITALDGPTRIAIAWDGTASPQQLKFWKGAQAGTAVYELNGVTGGRMSVDTEFTASVEDGTQGTFYVTVPGAEFAVGMTVVFCNVQNLIDDQGHTITTPDHPAKLWGYDNLRWKGNQGATPGAPGVLKIRKADLMIEASGAAYFRFCGFVEKVEISNPTPAAGGKVSLTLLDKARAQATSLCCFALNASTARNCSATAAVGMQALSGGEPDQNQYRPDNFSTKFGNTLNIYFGNIALADIPADMEITITPRYY